MSKDKYNKNAQLSLTNARRETMPEIAADRRENKLQTITTCLK